MDLNILASLSISPRIRGLCPKTFYNNVENYKVYVKCEIFTDVRIGNLILIRRLRSKKLELAPMQFVFPETIEKHSTFTINSTCLVRGDVFRNEYYTARIVNLKMDKNMCEVLDCFGRYTWVKLDNVVTTTTC